MRHDINETMASSTEANVYSLLEDPGNCRTCFNAHLTFDFTADSLLSEQQKLRRVLDLANSFLSSPSARQEYLTTETLQKIDLEINNVLKNSKQEQISTGQELPPSESSHEKSALFESSCHSDALLQNNEATKTVYATVQPETATPGHQKESSLCSDVRAKDTTLKTPSDLTVYEQYKLCADRLHRRKSQQSQSNEQENKVPLKEKTILEEKSQKVDGYGFTSHNYAMRQKDADSKAQKTELNKKFLAGIDEKQDILTNNGRAEYQRSVSCYYENTSGEENPAQVKISREMAVGKERSVRASWQKGHHQSRVRGEDKQMSAVLSEKLSSPLTNGRKQQRPQSSGQTKNIKSLHKQTDSKRHSTDVKPFSFSEDNNNNNCRPLSDHVDDYKHEPAGVPPSACWLSLPDELWLSVLSLLPLPDVLRVAPVCRRLLALTADRTLWRDVRIEKCTLTDWWLLCVGRRRPQSVHLQSCRGQRVTSWGLRTFFYLCRHSLQEVKVTGCTGAGVRGDLVLALIGQLCNSVSSVDVSWSGATDTGLRALRDRCQSVSLREVAVNGCHMTDGPLMDLLLRHKSSLCKLEVFGCQFVTSSCLETVYEMCPNLQYLNIGQLRNVSVHSLTVMALKLKNLISLNVTGLPAVTDVVMDTLLQNCSHLQTLTLSSCPGVTDQTLHSVSKHTPLIRSLDVSGCTAVTDAGVKALALGCTSLQQLDLSSTATGNRGVTLLANYCSKHLLTVKLSFCRIGPESVLKLCQHGKRLKLLHVYGCAQAPTQKQIRRVNSTVTVQPLSTDRHTNIFKQLDTRHVHKINMFRNAKL